MPLPTLRPSRRDLAPRRAIGASAAAVVWLACAALASVGGAAAAGDEPQVGPPAPDFSATDSGGTVRHLADFRGKTVVLEWTNCSIPKVFWVGSIMRRPGRTCSSSMPAATFATRAVSTASAPRMQPIFPMPSPT